MSRWSNPSTAFQQCPLLAGIVAGELQLIATVNEWQVQGDELGGLAVKPRPRLCENAAKTPTRLHHGSPWLLIGLADQQGLQ
jgi:hypothetical protein